MFTCIMDAPSPFHVDLPNAAENIVVFNCSEDFVTYDQTLPPEKQSPFTSELVDLIDEAAPYLREFKSSEARRVIASEALKQLDVELKSTLDDLSLVIRAKFLKAPSRAEEWGFSIKQSTGNVSYPVARHKRMAVLKSYIEKEESRPEKERFTKPELAMVINLRNELKANLVARRNSRRRRKSSQSTRMTALRKLYDCLRVAASVIIIKHFDHAISPEMGNWGYEVVKRQSTEKEVETAPASNGSDASSTNGTETTSTNGAANSDTTVSADAATNGQVDLDGAVEGVVEASD